tara:strand:- start:8731 stop:10188 length:1458 start_codon:yes stop_codon:yes gene_type:complete
MRALRRLVRDIASSSDVPAGTPPAFVALLDAASAVHHRLAAARRWAYDERWLTPTKVPAPVVSVGDVTWGRTGKTPMAEYIAREIADEGFAPVVLSRGYWAGNEATMLRRRLADVPNARVLVGKDRYKLARDALEGNKINTTQNETQMKRKGFDREKRFAGDVDVDDTELRCVTEKHESASGQDAESGFEPNENKKTQTAFVLDDGAQHLRLHRDLEIVMVNTSYGWGNAKIFPRGPLREPIGTVLSTADIIALHRFPCDDGTEEFTENELEKAKEIEREVRGYIINSRKANQINRVPPLVIKTHIRPTKIERLARYVGDSPPHEWRPPISRLRGSRVFCPSGVGDANSVKRLLESLTAPAVNDPKNGYGLRLRQTGSVEVWDYAGHDDVWFDEFELQNIVGKFKAMHKKSGDVGQSEARLVLFEADVGRILGNNKRKFDTLAMLQQCDPLVLCTELVVSDDRDAAKLKQRLEETLRKGTTENRY